MIPMGSFKKQVQQYKPVEVVLMCAAISRDMDLNKETLRQVPFTGALASSSVRHTIAAGSVAPIATVG